MKVLACLALGLVAASLGCSSPTDNGEPKGSTSDALKYLPIAVVCSPCDAYYVQTCTNYVDGEPAGSYVQRCFTYYQPAPPPPAASDPPCDGGECQGCGPTGCMGTGGAGGRS